MNVLQEVDEFWRYQPVLWGVVFIFLVFLLWAGLSEIDQHVTATGRIVPSGNARTVQHLEGGIVQKILVVEGQQVRAGERLFEVANTMAKSRLQEGNLELLALQLAQLRVRAEVAGEDNINFDAQTRARYPHMVESEETLFQANQQQYRETLRILSEQLKQKSLAKSALEVKVSNLEKEQAVTARQAQLRQQLFKSGATSEARYLDAVSQHRKLVTALEQAKGELPIVEAEKEELQSRIEEKQQEREALLSEQLNTIDQDIRTLSKRVAAFADEVERSDIVSPISGTLNKLYINTEGGVIQAGAPVAEITPADEVLVVEGQINTIDRGKVWPSLPVMTKISAYDYTIYGGIDGQLTYISPDSFVDKQNVEHYKVRVTLNSTHMLQDPELKLQPGMTAEVSILTGKKSVLAALFKPLTNIGNRALRET